MEDQLVKSVRRVAVRSFASVARPMAVPSRPTTPWTAVATTAIVSPSRQQQVSPLSPRSPTRSLGAIRAWPSCSPCLRLMQKTRRKQVNLRNIRNVTMTPVTVLTVKRKLGTATPGLDVDKHLKIDEPLGTIYLSHKPCPIKVVNTALSETTKADQIAIETAKTGKVTAVVAVISIFGNKKCKMQSQVQAAF
jgi:hypothetical protein